MCASNEDLPLFFYDWWLDAVCGPENWDVVFATHPKSGEISGFLPFFEKRAAGIFSGITMPPLTMFLGPWLTKKGNSDYRNIQIQKEVISELIDQIPKFDYFVQYCHYDFQFWLPFYWRGFRQSTAYSYVIEDINDLENVWSKIQGNRKGDIRKAQSKFGVSVTTEDNTDRLFELTEMTFRRQSISSHLSRELIDRVFDTCRSRDRCKIMTAVDREGRAHASVLIVWDKARAYYLLGGSDPKWRNSGALSAVIWEAIQQCSGTVSSFDFEGSMIEPIEFFFRGFGGVPMPYYRISKDRSILLRIVRALKN